MVALPPEDASLSAPLLKSTWSREWSLRDPIMGDKPLPLDTCNDADGDGPATKGMAADDNAIADMAAAAAEEDETCG